MARKMMRTSVKSGMEESIWAPTGLVVYTHNKRTATLRLSMMSNLSQQRFTETRFPHSERPQTENQTCRDQLPGRERQQQKTSQYRQAEALIMEPVPESSFDGKSRPPCHLKNLMLSEKWKRFVAPMSSSERRNLVIWYPSYYCCLKKSLSSLC